MQPMNIVQIGGNPSNMRPYNNIEVTQGFIIREFSQDVDSEELKWHRDREDRLIEPLEDTDWMVQIDGNLPILIKNQIFIPKGVWHRAIKGTKSLKIKITKYG